ncbi:hypothetical protein, partial [Aeromonas veronii]|uniref:hypothetical protein n=1 Tax=Aeromonas veronii TaxID=654 RepID=UPI003D1A385A
QKAPSVAVTWGWRSHDLLADLGNNAVLKWFDLINHRDSGAKRILLQETRNSVDTKIVCDLNLSD